MSTLPLYMRLYREMREKIETGLWPAGMKMLSVREQAGTLGVSKFTVERVYGQLAAEGYIRAGNRSRYRVASQVTVRRMRPSSAPLGKTSDTSPVRYDFATAAMDREGFSFAQWRRCFYRVWRREEDLLRYGDERGEPELREALASYGAQARDTYAGAEAIVVGSGTQQLLRILAGLLREDYGAVVFTEREFPLGIDTFAAEGYTVRLAAPSETVSDLLARTGRALVYVLPSLIYRSSAVMPARRRAELLAWAEAQDGLIIEDDFDCELSYYGAPVASLQGMGDGKRVVYIGSLSKVLPPSFRLAYMILPPELNERFEARRHLYRQTASVAEQLALADYIRRGALTTQIRKLRGLYRRKWQALRTALTEAFGARLQVDEPTGGIYCRIRLATELSREELYRRALTAGVALRRERRPLGETAGEASFLLAFGQVPQEEFPAAAAALAAAWLR